MIELNKIYCESNLETMGRMPNDSIHCCVTSPPYFGLRNYGVDGQIGLEATPTLFIAKMVEVFQEVRRVLRPDGVLFLNLGDSYAGSNKGVMADGSITGGKKQQTHLGTMTRGISQSGDYEGFKPKDLMLMPHRVVIALQDAGWWVRSDMPWVKRSAMPESVTDRPAKALEYVFMLTKSKDYFFDMEAVRVRMADVSLAQYKQGYDGKGIKDYEGNGVQNPSDIKSRMIAKHNRDRSLPTNRNGITGSLDRKRRPHGIVRDRLLDYESKEAVLRPQTKRGGYANEHDLPEPVAGRNFRNSDLWYSSLREPHGLVGVGDELVGLDVNPSGFSEAHFATYPPKLIEPLILAGCPSGGIVYDPFMGAGTTALVSHKLGRQWIGSELNAEYVKMANKRLEPYLAQESLF